MPYDNTCKYLAEEYPADFVRWLLGTETNNIQVLKTELSAEPIRADALILLQIGNQILHLEFQTTPASEPPMPFRMLQYWARLQWEYWGKEIEQVVIFLKRTNSPDVLCDRYEGRNTWHRYRVIRMWEQDPTPLLANPGLLPLATLARSDFPSTLVEQVADRVARIEESQRRQNISACAFVLAGLRFEENLIRQLLTEEIMQESVTYQYILQKGVQQGLQQGVQQGRKEGEVAMLVRQLTRRFGAVEPHLQERLQTLSISQLEELGEVLLEFSAASDLVAWLDAQEQ